MTTHKRLADFMKKVKFVTENRNHVNDNYVRINTNNINNNNINSNDISKNNGSKNNVSRNTSSTVKKNNNRNNSNKNRNNRNDSNSSNINTSDVKNGSDGSNLFIYTFNEMEIISNKLFELREKKFNKLIIRWYEIALNAFDPKKLENKSILQLHESFEETILCEILNGAQKVFNADSFTQEITNLLVLRLKH